MPHRVPWLQRAAAAILPMWIHNFSFSSLLRCSKNWPASAEDPVHIVQRAVALQHRRDTQRSWNLHTSRSGTGVPVRQLRLDDMVEGEMPVERTSVTAAKAERWTTGARRRTSLAVSRRRRHDPEVDHNFFLGGSVPSTTRGITHTTTPVAPQGVRHQGGQRARGRRRHRRPCRGCELRRLGPHRYGWSGGGGRIHRGAGWGHARES